MDFKLLGLSEYESRTYTAVVKLGRSKASDIAREGNISYGKIYDVLASLEHKGLVAMIPEKTRVFVASNPDNLMKLINKKEEQISKTKKEIADLKQIYSESKEDAVLVLRGKRNFYKINSYVSKSKKYEYVIKYNFEYRPEFIRGVTRQLRNKQDYKVIGRFNKETVENISKWEKDLKEKKLPLKIKPIKNDGVAMSYKREYLCIDQ